MDMRSLLGLQPFLVIDAESLRIKLLPAIPVNESARKVVVGNLLFSPGSHNRASLTRTDTDILVCYESMCTHESHPC